MTRYFILLLVAVAVAVSARAADRPNIILMMADDQGWGETGYNGHPHLKTPVLDEMARTALRLDRFYAASPVCSPTRTSVLTGRHANRSGAFAPNWSRRAKSGPRVELFDLLADPSESTDIATKHPDIVRRMTDQLHAWQRSVERSLSGADY